MALNRQATINVLRSIRATSTPEIFRLLSDAMVNGKAEVTPVKPAPLYGTTVTVHHAGSQYYTIEIH